MARITASARKHAARFAATRQRGRYDDVLEDDELGDVVGDVLGSLPIIGGLFGGGGKPAATPAASAGSSGGMDAATLAAAMAAKGPATTGSGTEVAVHHATEIAKRPTRADLRSIVKDAIKSHAATTNAAALQEATHARLADEHAQKITQALAPRAAQTRGGIQEQRLQAQATAEHNAIMRREARTRTEDERYTNLMAKLADIVDRVQAMQKRLGRAEIVTGRAIDILGGRDALEKHR